MAPWEPPRCERAPPTPSDADRGALADALKDDAIAFPILSVTVGRLSSEDGDRLLVRPRRGMAEKLKPQMLPE